jgi:hypothetical protein
MNTIDQSDAAIRCETCTSAIVREGVTDPWFHEDSGKERCLIDGVESDKFARPSDASLRKLIAARLSEINQRLDAGYSGMPSWSETTHIVALALWAIDHGITELAEFDSLYDASPAESAEERCFECNASLDDGEGYDGRCGNCADRHEAGKDNQHA